MSIMPESNQEIVYKFYRYIRNGKSQIIRRIYKIKGDNKAKRLDLREYFDIDYDDDLNIKENYKLYNDTAVNKVSYSMFYSNYKKYLKKFLD